MVGRPGGFSDWLVGAAARRRAIASALIDAFTAAGFGLIDTPTVEYLDSLARGVGAGRQDELFRFMDADGRLLALVGERTVSVARTVATQLRAGPFPLRLSYAGPVLRNQPLLGGRRREALQAGCELVGEPSLEADAECIALTVTALDAAGIEAIQVDVGHARFIPSLLDAARLSPEVQAEVRAALARRDLVAVESAFSGTDTGAAEHALLLRFPALRGGRELLDTARTGLGGESLAILDELARLWELLAARGLGERVHVDLGAVRDFDYYTGPTFEVFSGDLGFPLGSGGRYDTLLARFGLDQPATGFVVHVDRCHDAVQRGTATEASKPAGLRIAVPTGTLLRDACALLRDAGVTPGLRPETFERRLQLQSDGHDIILVRPTDVPVYVEMGACDLGIVGKDVLWESRRELYELADLGFGGCRLVLAAPAGSPLAEGRWPAGPRVATKYPQAARRFLESLSVQADIIKLHGSVELAPAGGLADAVVDVVATGATLRANNLVEVDQLGASTARLIANVASMKTRSAAVTAVATALRGHVEAATR